jgi:hypothetical protein
VADDPRVQAALEQARQLLGPELQEVAGARVSGEIPVSEALLNRLVAERLRGGAGPLESVELQVRPGGVLLARVRLRKPRFAPAIMIAFTIERQPSPPESMDLVLQWTLPGLGIFAAVAAPVLSFFKSGPPGVRADGEHLLVDLAALARAQGYAALLPFVTGLRLATGDAVLVVAFDLSVKGRGPTEAGAGTGFSRPDTH